jgi:exopolysaccharide production protein ExoQ
MNVESRIAERNMIRGANPFASRAGTNQFQISLLGAGVGFLFSTRTIYVLVAARWLNIETEAGVMTGLAIGVALITAALLNAFGGDTYSLGRILRLRPVQWIMLYLIYSGCSLLWTASASSVSSAVYWGGLVGDVGVVLLLARGCSADRVAHSLMKGFVVGACLLAATAWMMPSAADLRLGDIEYFNTNQIGNLCALSILMCGLLAARGDGRWRAVSWFLAITLCRSLSKTTLAAFIVCQAYRLVRDPDISRRRKWLTAGGALLVALCFWSLATTYYSVYTATDTQAESLTGRTAIWAWTLDAGLAKPWFGNGFDAMWKVAPPFGGELFEARHAENELLQQFFAYGVIGIVLLTGIYGSLYRQIRVLPRSSERTAIAAFLVYVLVRGIAEAEPFDLLLPLWLITGLSLLLPARQSRRLFPHHELPANGLREPAG